MHFTFYLLPTASVSLEVILLWRLWKGHLLRRLPYFAGFIIFDLVRSAALFIVVGFLGRFYGAVYWITEITYLAVRFLIIIEVARSLFPSSSVLRLLAWKFLGLLAAILVPGLTALGWSQYRSSHYGFHFVPPIFEQYVSLVQAFLLLTVIIIARYYAIRLGRSAWALAFGFGVYLSLCAANFASLQAIKWFLPYWRMLYPATFVAMIGLWAWGFWNYEAPSPDMSTARADLLLKRHWDRIWTRTITALRRIN